MSSVKQERQSKIPIELEKYSKIGSPDGIVAVAHHLSNGTTSVQSLKTIIQSELGIKPVEIELSLLLLHNMGLLGLFEDEVACTQVLYSKYQGGNVSFVDWFSDRFIEYVMQNEIIDIDTITYEIGSDAYVMSHNCIKMKYAGFRNLLVAFNIIALRSDARYTICQKLDRYIIRPENRRTITEKQLYAQLEKKKELGNIGEEWVLEYEKRRISNPYLRSRIKRISLIDVGAGYDIVSFENDNSTEFDRFIEVKTFRGKEHFHWSRNEIEKANLMGDKYYIYLVDADCIEHLDYEPTIIGDPVIRIAENEGWSKRPDSYLVERIVKTKISNEIPVFQSVDDYTHSKKKIYYPYSEYEPSIPDRQISASSFSSYYNDDSDVTAADPVDVKTLTEEKRNGILKKSLERLFDITDYSGDKLFKMQEQWIGIYRGTVDMGFTIENDYGFFVSLISKLGITEIPIPVSEEILEKCDNGEFAKPVEEWTLSSYRELNNNHSDNLFYMIFSVAEKFISILHDYIPQKFDATTSVGNAEAKLSEVSEREQLNNENVVFNCGITLNGQSRRVNMSGLKSFIQEHFVERISYQYEWAALYLFCSDKKLLSGYSPADFEKQMNNWFENSSKKCSSNDISRYYTKLQNDKAQDWPIKFSEDQKMPRMKKVYEDLEDNFDYNKVLF